MVSETEQSEPVDHVLTAWPAKEREVATCLGYGFPFSPVTPVTIPFTYIFQLRLELVVDFAEKL